MDVYQRRRLVALSAVAAVFIIIVLLIRSCGDDEEPTTPLSSGASVPGVSQPLSQEDYVDEADAICLQANNSLAAIDTADTDQAAAEEAQLLGSELDQLQTLSVPTDGADKLQNFLEALQTQVQALEDRVLAAERGNETRVVELDTTIADAEADAERAANRFGFQVCGDLSAVGERTGGNGDGATEETTGETATTPVVPVTPTTTVPLTPPADTATEGGVATEPADPGTDTGTDTGGTDPGSGGVSP
jgi:hypothetical protein